MPNLPAAFLRKLVLRLEDENTLGVLMSGSFARGEENLYSDVDIWHYVRQQPEDHIEMPRLEFVDGYLVSVKTTLLEKDYVGLRTPQQAIWVIPALRQAHILLDKNGVIAALKEAARNITWKTVQPAADAFASRNLAGTAEEVYKILSGLAQRNESKTLYAIWSLTRELADCLLVQRGVFIPTENAYLDCAQAAAGRTSRWTRQFRLATGLETLPSREPATVRYGVAGLHLYLETATILRKILLTEDAELVDRTLESIAEAGY